MDPKQGFVRVLLTKLANQFPIKIGIFGDYELDGKLRFQRGMEILVSKRDNGFLVQQGGLNYLAGSNLQFKRYAQTPGSENGLRLNGGLNLYTGDLVLSSNSDKLTAVLKAPIEEYLLGVVPYEMSDEFPLEALKAQAVAARTYTLSHLKPDSPYDVVDNTNDQVYKGFNAENVNATRAVLETAGQCLSYKGKLARCYYTASNGGFSASAKNAWGKEEIPYLGVKEDSYDKENPLSPKRTVILPKGELKDSPVYQKLEELFLPQLCSSLGQNGYNPDPAQVKIHQIICLSLEKQSDPLNPQISFTFRVSAQKKKGADGDRELSLQSPTPSTEKTLPVWEEAELLPNGIKMTCPVFPAVEKAFDLSLNQSANELYEVLESKDEYLIIARRYGHGVGMSQRGAESRAGKAGWDYRKILDFYYTGTKIQKITTSVLIPESPKENFLATPGPVPSPTPRPTLMPQTGALQKGEWLILVTGIAQNSTLNLRESPSLSAKIKGILYYGQQMIAIERQEDGWIKVRNDLLDGYIREEFTAPKP